MHTHHRFMMTIIAISFFLLALISAGSLIQNHRHDFWQFEIPDNQTEDEFTAAIQTKVVLLWTSFFGDRNWSDHFAHNHGPNVDLEINNNNNKQRCYFTTDRSYLANSTAVVIHGRDDLNFNDLPKQRLPWQRWIFYLLESPLLSRIESSEQWQQVNALQFNWTMSYSKLANVYFPYGYVRPSKSTLQQPDYLKTSSKIHQFATSFQERPIDAVWIVSNCETHSKREEIVRQLISLGVTFHIFGNCTGVSPDVYLESLGSRRLFSRYRFIFALENSLCEDYITEKAFHAFYANFIAGPIPVVYGGGDYSDFFPDGSYIDMRLFENIADLAKLLKILSKSDENSLHLLQFYDWHFDVNPIYQPGYELKPSSPDLYDPFYVARAGWRNLCKKLWDEDNGVDNSYIEDIRTQLGTCMKPFFIDDAE